MVIFTKLFSGINVKRAHKTSNVIQNILAYKNMGAIYKCDRSGIYQLTCPDCRDKYIGQTARSFWKRYTEHIQSFKYRNSNSIFAKHLHDSRHSFGPRIMDTVHFVKIRKLTNSLETFDIYSKNNNQINEESTTGSNTFYDVEIQHENDSSRP
jgi:hypothetical protein